MANIIWNNLIQNDLVVACNALGAGQQSLSYLYVALGFALLLILIHTITTVYENFDEKTSETVSSELNLTGQPATVSSVVWRKRDKFTRLQKDIDERFNKSIMNQTYSFPRNED